MAWKFVVHVRVELHLANKSLANVHKLLLNCILQLGVEECLFHVTIKLLISFFELLINFFQLM